MEIKAEKNESFDEDVLASAIETIFKKACIQRSTSKKMLGYTLVMQHFFKKARDTGKSSWFFHLNDARIISRFKYCNLIDLKTFYKPVGFMP